MLRFSESKKSMIVRPPLDLNLSQNDTDRLTTAARRTSGFVRRVQYSAKSNNRNVTTAKTRTSL